MRVFLALLVLLCSFTMAQEPVAAIWYPPEVMDDSGNTVDPADLGRGGITHYVTIGFYYVYHETPPTTIPTPIMPTITIDDIQGADAYQIGGEVLILDSWFQFGEFTYVYYTYHFYVTTPLLLPPPYIQIATGYINIDFEQGADVNHQYTLQVVLK